MLDIISSAQNLRDKVDALSFDTPVTHVYNPLQYAWSAHEKYLTEYASGKKRVVFLGMNPGPWGMAQTGVPFGEIDHAKNWMGIDEAIMQPKVVHPKRPIEGFNCERSEVSGRRLWGLFKERFGKADTFFKDHFVANYCPLVFMEESSRNRTPDKLPAAEQGDLYAHCDRHLRELVECLEPDYLVGVGAFAMNRAKEALDGINITIAKVLHPSPASPAANRGWAEQATKQLIDQGIWE